MWYNSSVEGSMGVLRFHHHTAAILWRPCFLRQELGEQDSRFMVNTMLYNDGLSSSQFYKTLYEQQQGRCAICGEWYEKLFIDHDHKTGEVRQLLCPTCNFGLGSFKDNENILQKAFRYLTDWKMNVQTRDLLERVNGIQPVHSKVISKREDLDWRQVSKEQRKKVANMSTSEIVICFGVSERTARNWRKYAQDEVKP
jgi:hypothetical protein